MEKSLESKQVRPYSRKVNSDQNLEITPTKKVAPTGRFQSRQNDLADICAKTSSAASAE